MSDDRIVKLNLASRIVILNMLSNPESVTSDIPRKTRSITRALKLQEADEERDKLVEPKERAREPALLHNQLQNEMGIVAAREGKQFTPNYIKVPSPYKWEELSATEIEEFAINKDDLAWLKGIADKYHWDIRKTTNQMGQQVELKINIDIGMQIAIADMEDALLDAREKKEQNGDTEKHTE